MATLLTKLFSRHENSFFSDKAIQKLRGSTKFFSQASRDALVPIRALDTHTPAKQLTTSSPAVERAANREANLSARSLFRFRSPNSLESNESLKSSSLQPTMEE